MYIRATNYNPNVLFNWTNKNLMKIYYSSYFSLNLGIFLRFKGDIKLEHPITMVVCIIKIQEYFANRILNNNVH